MRSETKRGIEQTGRYGTDHAMGQTLSLPPLPDSQSFLVSSKNADAFFKGGQVEKFVPDFGKNEQQSVNVVLPPLKGMRQMLDSEVTTRFLKDMTSASSTVLMQTYMMVENGAATGFMGGMNIGSNLMQNMLQTQQFQLDMMDASDSSGQMKEAYAKKIASILQKPEYQDVWPSALYIASGEDNQAPKVKMAALPTESEPFDLAGLDPARAADRLANKKLSDLLFYQSAQASPLDSQGHQNPQLNTLKEDFVKFVGDVELRLSNPNQLAKTSRDLTLAYSPPAWDDEHKRRGIAAVNWTEVQVVWVSLNEILYQVCDWKTKNPNAGKKQWQMETLASTKDIGGAGPGGGSDPWEIASSPDIPLTMNVVEQLYEFVEKNPGKDFTCDQLKKGFDDMPDSDASGADAANLNDCSGKNGCKKNRLVLYLSYLIARSKTLHQYRTLYGISKRFATEPLTDNLLERLFVRALSGMDLQEEIGLNRARFDTFVVRMSELAQGDTGSGGIARPGTSENSTQSAMGGFKPK